MDKKYFREMVRRGLIKAGRNYTRITEIEQRHGLEAARLWAHDSSAAVVEAHYIHRDTERLRQIAQDEA